MFYHCTKQQCQWQFLYHCAIQFIFTKAETINKTAILTFNNRQNMPMNGYLLYQNWFEYFYSTFFTAGRERGMVGGRQFPSLHTDGETDGGELRYNEP